jgi:putative tryptophan/tyrosine transport system substrate-binding protein
MRRRDFITLLGGAAAAWPLVARAQQPAMPVVGWLNSGSALANAASLHAFQQGLRDVGYVENQNVVIEYRWADSHNERLPALAADLARRQVAVIATNEFGTTLAAKAATTTIPIVFRTGVDPVQAGLVASLNRPGGNLTGVTALNTELSAKRLELLHEFLPTATIMAALINPSAASGEPVARELQAASHVLGLEVHVVHATTEQDFETAFATLSGLRASGLVITGGQLYVAQAERLAALALSHAVPAIFQVREFAAAGGLMSYGASRSESYRIVGVYAGRILKGEKPADLPVQQATKVELIINLKTAQSLGLNVPQLLLGRTDEIIE